jgi:hypothetical protein
MVQYIKIRLVGTHGARLPILTATCSSSMVACSSFIDIANTMLDMMIYIDIFWLAFNKAVQYHRDCRGEGQQPSNWMAGANNKLLSRKRISQSILPPVHPPRGHRDSTKFGAHIFEFLRRQTAPPQFCVWVWGEDGRENKNKDVLVDHPAEDE